MVRDQTLPDDRAISVFLLLLGALAVLAAAAYGVLTSRQNPPLAAAGNYGAIAISATTLDSTSAWGYGDASSATRRALSECNAHSTRGDCAVRLNLTGNCGALATSRVRSESYAAADNDKTLAGALALAECQSGGAGDCVLRQSFCGDGS
jgi:Domain of unknown function (DUF4189)